MNILRKIKCSILDWHSPAIEPRDWFINRISLCKYCHRIIMQDSQGNWFS